MLERKIGAIVVLQNGFPVGIVGQTNLLQAYHDDLTLDHTVEEIMSTKLETCVETMSRDQAAHIMECTKNHHVIVLNKEGEFRGLLSSWDIAVECAKDGRAWPWNRPEDGVFHNPNTKKNVMDTTGTSPTSAADEAHISNLRQGESSKRESSFRDYIDHLGYFD